MKMIAKIVIVINPRAGRAASRCEALIRERLADSTVEIVRTTHPGHATEIAHRAAQEGCAAVVAVGGDGTVNEVLTGLIGSKTALGILPFGSANDMASHLGLPRDLVRACDIIRTDVRRSVDVVRINDRFFLTGGGIGLACEVARAANHLRNWGKIGRLLWRLLKSWIYIVAALWTVIVNRKHHTGVKITSAAGTVEADALTVTIANQPFIGRRFRLSLAAENDDGLFDVCLIRNSLNRRGILKIMKQAMVGSHVLSPVVASWKSRFLKIELDEPRPFLLDGEVAPASKSLEFRIMPSAVDLLVAVGSAQCQV